ncbi:lysozyme C, milk isozyme-like [Liasis olivaceus]
MKALVLTLLFSLIAANEAKVFTKCELASVLKRHGLDAYHGYGLGNWVGMAYHKSGYNTKAVGWPNWDGSRDYGIFQINSRWWCNNKQGRTANGCKKICGAFTDDDITEDNDCAKRIVQDPNKMGAWVAWRNNCKGRDLSQWTHDCGPSDS